jgi:hypothetical protein
MANYNWLQTQGLNKTGQLSSQALREADRYLNRLPVTQQLTQQQIEAVKQNKKDIQTILHKRD